MTLSRRAILALPALAAVAAVGVLDLDHLGAHIRQDLGAQRPGDDAGEVDDADALEGRAA